MHFPPALRHRKFLYIWLGLLISVAGSQMQLAAIHWHIRELTGEPDPLALGGIGLARILPILFLSVIGGALADSYNRRTILFITQSVLALQALALAFLTIGGHITIWQIYALTAIQAAAMAFDLPARQALVPNLVPREALSSAFSLATVAFNTGAIVGPLLFVAVSAGGQENAYLFNAISFLAVLAALFFMGDVPQDMKSASGINLAAIWDGVRFIKSRPLILSTMLMDFVATFFASANTMLPIVARDILHVGRVGYGWLISAEAIGSVVAGLIVSQVRELRKQGPVFLASVALFGLATVWFGLTRSLGPAMIALFLVGVGDAVSTVIRQTIRQLQTPDSLRGRMISINQVFFMGGPQLGEVEAGVVAALFGVPFAIVSGGIGCILGMGLIVWKWPHLLTYNQDESSNPQFS